MKRDLSSTKSMVEVKHISGKEIDLVELALKRGVESALNGSNSTRVSKLQFRVQGGWVVAQDTKASQTPGMKEVNAALEPRLRKAFESPLVITEVSFRADVALDPVE